MPATPPPSQQARAHALMVAYAVLISTSFPVGAAITHDLDPVVLTFCRFAIATTLFGVLLLRTGQLRRPTLSDLARYTAVSASIVVFFCLMFEALRWTSPVSTGALFTLVPLGSAGFGWLLLRQRSGPWQLLCLGVGALGAVWVVFDGSIAELARLRLDRGELVFLAGACSFAAYSPLIKRLWRGETALVMTFWTLAVGALMLAVVGAGRLAATPWTDVPGRAWLGVGWLAVFPTAVTFGIAQFASVRLPPAKVMGYTYLTPALVVLIEGLVGHGWPTGSVAAGVVVTFSATLLLQRS